MKQYNNMPGKVTLCAVMMLMVGAMLSGCTTADVKAVTPVRSEPDTNVMLMPGDEIDVKFFYTPELNELQRVRPDGKISLQLVGDVQAAGLRPDQVQKVLEAKYTGLIERPSVVVIARNLQHRTVYIGGAVQKPGIVEMPGSITALSAILQSGGFYTSEANLKEVLVLRHDGDTAQQFTLNLQDALSGKAPHEPFYLHSQDIVFVQRTGVVKTAEWISQHINQMVPQFGFTYFYDSGSDSSTIGLDTSTSRR